MKKTVSMILCVLMLASCLALYAVASEDTTAADTTEATEDTTAAQEIERANDLIVFNTDLITKPNPLMGNNGLTKNSGVSKKGEWDGFKIEIKNPEDPNFSFNYTTYCKKYDLTPLTSEDVSYVVLKVMVPEDGYYDDFELFYCAGNVTVPAQDYAATSEYCDEGNGFVYFIYNLEGAWEGEINQFRIDPVGSDEGEILYLMEIALFKTEDDAITWCDFDEEETEETTEAKTEAPTTEKVTEEESTRDPAATRPGKEDKKNCNSVIGVGAIVAMLSLGIVCFKKKD